MSVEFFGKVNPKRLTSLSDDFKTEQDKYLADEARFKKYKTNKPELADLLASNAVVPASKLLRIRNEEAATKQAFEDAVQSEESHRKKKRPNSTGDIRQIYSREKFVD